MQQLTTIQVKSEENTFNSIIYKPMVTVDEPEVAVYKDENAQDSQKQFQPVEIMIQTQPHVEEQAVNHDYHQVAWPFRLTYSEEEKKKKILIITITWVPPSYRTRFPKYLQS